MPRYIDADAFYEHIEIMPRGERYFGNIQDDLKVFPTADVAPVVHSHWIHTGEYLTNSDGKRLRKLSDLYVCHRCHLVE